MKIFRNLKLQYKMLILAIIPVLVMGIVAILISNTVVKNKLLDDAKQKLKATSNAVLAAYDQNAGDYFVNATGDVWKGAYNVSLSTPFIDDIAAKTGIEVTFFYNDTRLVTSLKDADGKRILGSKAGDFLVENVLQDGNEVFTNRVLVDGTFYFGYYVPVYQNNSDEIIGMVFAGMPVKEIYASLNLITMIFTVAILVILVIAVIGCLLLSRGIAKTIRNSMDVVKQISEGNLNVEIEQSMLDRKDEAGALSCNTQTLIDNLSAMIGKISNNTMTLNASSEEMNAAAGQAGNAVGNINVFIHYGITDTVIRSLLNDLIIICIQDIGMIYCIHIIDCISCQRKADYRNRRADNYCRHNFVNPINTDTFNNNRDDNIDESGKESTDNQSQKTKLSGNSTGKCRSH